ncbi:MAG TPA: OsmC family protein [Rhizomicrobium sp.]|nr:OsmC family protein [Rhizomicrobium sp.]
MTRARAIIGTKKYSVRIEADGHMMAADEPPSNGGAGSAPDPYELLLASLGACTAITLRMYVERKGWNVRAIGVDLHFVRKDKEERIDRTVTLDGELSEEQRARIAEIAEKTPVTLTLKRGLAIKTDFAPAGTEIMPDLDERLDEALEETFPASDPPAVTL